MSSGKHRVRTASVIAAISAVLFITGSRAQAGTQTGYVTFLEVRDTDGLIYFGLSGTASGKPTCAVFPAWTLPNEGSETGKKLFALLVSARTAGQQVSVNGKNTCVRWGDQEDVASIRVTD